MSLIFLGFKSWEKIKFPDPLILQSLGLTIEDAEEELGLPRGWSGVSGLPEHVRWKYLRKEADGCNAQEQFERWLGKRGPHPDDEV